MPGEGWAICLHWADEEATGEKLQSTASSQPAPLAKLITVRLCIGSRLVEFISQLHRHPKVADYPAVLYQRQTLFSFVTILNGC